MEYFDVIDKNRNFLNYTKERGEKLKENEYNQGAEIWIINDNRILMTKRSLNKSHPNKWETPGGCSQTKETTLDTAIRELKEEIGITINKNNIKLIKTQIYKKQFVDIFECNIPVNLKNTTLQKEEVSDIKFVTKDEFAKMKKNNEIVPSVLTRYELIKYKINLDW